MNKSGSLTTFLVFGLLVGMCLIVGPFFIPEGNVNPLSQMVIVAFGAILTLLFGILVIITRLYRKTTADEAFVRTGMRGRCCIIDEKVQSQRVARNTIQREADQKVKEQDVRTGQYIAQQDVVQAKALADAGAEKAMATAQAEQRAKTVAAEQHRLASVAEVEADRQIELAKVDQNKAVQVANQQREQANEVAEVEKQKTVELARRAQQIAIAEAEAQQLAAQQQREAAAQQVKTVEVKLTAEREKDKAVIAKQAEVEQQKIARQMDADVAAYAQVKQAEAEQTAADRQATARVALAEAARQAKSLEAEGDQAVQMVPVNVAREQVNVEDARVTVKIRDLEGQSKFESIARELQVQLATIEAEKQAKIAAANAMGEAMAKANINLWGDPHALERITGAFFNGQSIGSFAGGLTSSLPPAVAEIVKKFTGAELPTTPAAPPDAPREE